LSHGYLDIDIGSSGKNLGLIGASYENTDMDKKDHFVITQNKIPSSW